MKEIDSQADSYLAVVKKLAPSEKQRRLEQITKLFSKSSEYGDDKVTLAMQTYEMVSWSLHLQYHIVSIELDWIKEYQWVNPLGLWDAISGEGWVQV